MKAEEIKKILDSDREFDRYMSTLPPRLGFMTEEKRRENVRMNLQMKLVRINRKNKVIEK